MDHERINDITEELREDLQLPPMLTRDQILEELLGMGYQVTEWQLRSWAAYGLLPRPLRRVPEGATDGVARALYPAWMVDAIAFMIHELAQGVSRANLKAIMPDVISSEQTMYEMERIGSWAGNDDEFEAIQRKLLYEDIEASTKRLPAPPPPRIPRALMRAAHEYARRVAEGSGTPVASISLEIQLENGETQTIAIPSPEIQEDK